MDDRPGSFFWKFLLGHFALLLVAIMFCVWMVWAAFEVQSAQLQSHQLVRLARSMSRVVAKQIDRDPAIDLEWLAKRLGTDATDGIRVTIINANGTVAGDSEVPLSAMESQLNDPEFIEALNNGEAEATKWSHSASRTLSFAAVRIGPAERPWGLVRVGIDPAPSGLSPQITRTIAWKVAAVIILSGIALAGGHYRIWNRPIAAISFAANRLARGDLTARARTFGTDELAELATSLNRMGDRLSRQLESNIRQRRTLEYLLAQLREGIIVADAAGAVVLMNPAASEMLGSPVSISGDTDRIEGLAVESCVPQHSLQQMLLAIRRTDRRETAKETPHPSDSDAFLDTGSHDHTRLTIRRSDGDVTLLAQAWDIILPRRIDEGREGAMFMPSAKASEKNGRLLVLFDITELEQGLQVKSDFAANASHELRTPLTAIRGAVETLIDLNDGDPQATRKLLALIDRHSHRLESLVNDLMELSRLESGIKQPPPSPINLGSFLTSMHDRFQDRIKSKQQTLDFHGVDGLETVVINQRLLGLILSNLVDNAIKFTPQHGIITVTANVTDNTLYVSVKDSGPGIARAEQRRVFERFYQSESGRSATVRGSGLGLSIVWHAIKALDGSIDLVSEPGQGAEFNVSIPCQPNPNDPPST